jgi:tetratricopeptide (TPR) repeat protein
MMISWDEIRGKIKRAHDEIESAYEKHVVYAVDKVKERPVLNTAVKIALSSIPGIGPNLRDLYDNIGGGRKPEEEKAKQILEFLGQLEQQNKKQFDRIAEDLNTNRNVIIEAISENRFVITDLISVTSAEILREIGDLKAQNRRMIRLLEERRFEKTQNPAHDTFSTKKVREEELYQLIDQPSMISTCIEFFYDGNHKKAIECFDKATEIDPNSARAWKVKGDAFLELGILKNQHKFLDEAIECFDKATEINLNYGSAWNNRAWALRMLGEYREAIKSFDKSIQANPNGATAWNDKGLTLLDTLGEYKSAIECFDKAIQIDPRYIEPLSLKGWAFDKLGEYDKALECYDKCIKIDPNMYGACLSKAWILLNRFDNPKGALDWYNRCIEIWPTSYRAWREKGMALNILQRYNDAKEAFDRARKIREEQQAHEQTHLGLWLTTYG